jgi:phosphoribosylformylglycinamidine synthase
VRENIVEWKVEVSLKSNINDAVGNGIAQDIKDLGITDVEQVRTAQLYWLNGNITEAELETICVALLTDSITQRYAYSSIGEGLETPINDAWVVEVNFKPGVTDAVGDSVMKGIRDLGISGIKFVRMGQKYVIKGNLTEEQIKVISRRLLANEVIHNFSCSPETRFL